MTASVSKRSFFYCTFYFIEVCFWQECCTADEVLWLQALVSTVNILFHLRAKGLYEEMVSSCFSQLEKVCL